MSLGYAEKLSWREDLGGQLGDPELFDSKEQVEEQAALLASWIKSSKQIVAFTGAGISTSCGIPDFRGPNGIWTLQRAGKPLPKLKTTFVTAKPSLTHQVLVALQRLGKLTYVVSQNVDGLHLRSGLPRQNIAELHGNCFAERCSRCKKEYVRDFEMETVGFKKTGRNCTAEGCRGILKDQILDWEDALPPDELKASEQAAAKADIAICLGTSLQITPACNIPLKTVRAGGRLVIVNLQKTPKDKKAAMLVRARCDEFLQAVVAHLELPVPDYIRTDRLRLGHRQSLKAKKSKDLEPISVQVFVESVHGRDCPLPLVDRVEISFPDMPDVEPRVLGSHPFSVQQEVAGPGPCRVALRVHLVEGVDENRKIHEVEFVANVVSTSSEPASLEDEHRGMTVAKEGRVWVYQAFQTEEFVSQVVSFAEGSGQEGAGVTNGGIEPSTSSVAEEAGKSEGHCPEALEGLGGVGAGLAALVKGNDGGEEGLNGVGTDSLGEWSGTAKRRKVEILS